MFIYILIKIIFSAIASLLKMDIKRGFIIFESIIVIIYVFLLYNDFLQLNIGLLLFFLFWIVCISLYKITNYIFIKRTIIYHGITNNVSVKKINNIKKFILKPIVLNIIYYVIWFLPWNMLYYLIFLLSEYLWYYRIWLVSVRDLFFLRLFGWDSRKFFFHLNKKLFENKIILYFYFCKEKIVKAFLRLFLFISFIRKNFLESSLKTFFLARLIVFCYLSLFYLYVFENILLLNIWLFYSIIVFEIFVLVFFDNFVIFFIKKDIYNKNHKYSYFFLLFFTKENLQLLLDPLNLTYYEPSKTFFEVNGLVWNKILGNSLSLNILHEFILFANKNTNGYFYHSKGISTKPTSIKLYELSNIPWDILPRTRYVIMSMRYVQQNVYNNTIINDNVNLEASVNEETDINILDDAILLYKNSEIPQYVPDFRIKNMKNYYLSFFEKTYCDNTLLITIYLLKLNYDTLYTWLYLNYYSELLKHRKLNKDFYIFDRKLSDIIWSKTQIWKLKLIEISKTNPELLRIEYILHLFEYENRIVDISSDYLVRFSTSALELPLLTKDFGLNKLSLTNYRNNIVLLSKLTLYDEEAIVWNSDLLFYFNCIENAKLASNYVDNLMKASKIFSTFGSCNKQSWRCNSQDAMKQSMVLEFGVVFNRELDLNSFDSFDFSKCLWLKWCGYKIVEVNCVFVEDITIMQELDNIIKDLEFVNFHVIYELRWDDSTLRATWSDMTVSYNNYLDKNKPK